ncbi:MAG: hypothetical protein RL693_2354 [Verrucomicrobiota bacterium]|jgi:glycosyltransferase involved in cell wall biosynthesis
MRIALVHYSAPPVIGGVERVLAQQAKILSRHGHEVIVVCGNKDAQVEGAEVQIGGNDSLKSCDVVIVHNMLTMPFQWDASRALAACSREMPNTRFINWVHDVDVSREAFTALKLNATHVAVSKVRQREFCKALKIPLQQCRVIPNGVEVSTLREPTPAMLAFAAKHRFNGRDCVLLLPTRVLARKNIELGIEITAALRARGADVLYVVTGAIDPHRKESAVYATFIQDLIEKQGLQDAVLFVSSEGKVEDADVQSLYLLADALLFPSKKEGFGLPLIEAALYQLPIFCSDIPIHREVMGRAAHYLDLESSPPALADFIRERLHRKPTGKAVQKLRDRYSWDRIYQDYLEPLLNEG